MESWSPISLKRRLRGLFGVLIRIRYSSGPHIRLQYPKQPAIRSLDEIGDHNLTILTHTFRYLPQSANILSVCGEHQKNLWRKVVRKLFSTPESWEYNSVNEPALRLREDFRSDFTLRASTDGFRIVEILRFQGAERQTPNSPIHHATICSTTGGVCGLLQLSVTR